MDNSLNVYCANSLENYPFNTDFKLVARTLKGLHH